jgi:hypothetical protein
MARYMLLIYSPTEGGPSQEEAAAEMPRWFEYTEALQKSGALLAGDALQGAETATTVRVRDGETIISDGPFAETKELLGGYYLIDAPDRETALEWAGKMPNINYGTVEVRPVMEIPAEVPQS